MTLLTIEKGAKIYSFTGKLLYTADSDGVLAPGRVFADIDCVPEWALVYIEEGEIRVVSEQYVTPKLHELEPQILVTELEWSYLPAGLKKILDV